MSKSGRGDCIMSIYLSKDMNPLGVLKLFEFKELKKMFKLSGQLLNESGMGK